MNTKHRAWLTALLVGAALLSTGSAQETPPPLVRSITIVEHWSRIPVDQAPAAATGVVVQGPEFLVRETNRVRQALTRYLDQAEAPENWLPTAMSDLEVVCRVVGHPLVDVFFFTRARELADQGHFYIVVIEGRLASVQTWRYRWPFFGGPAVGVYPLFRAEDLTDVTQFAGRLQRAERPIDEWFTLRLPKTTRDLLASQDPANYDPAALRTILLHDLNSVLGHSPIYDTNVLERLAGVELRPETADLLAKYQPGDDFMRLNRLLLEDAYAAELAKTTVGGSPTREAARRNRLANRLLGLPSDTPYTPGTMGFEADTLRRGLDRLNREPDYQQADMVLQRSEIAGGTDLILSVTNRLPVEPFVGYNTEGNTLTGDDRVFAGLFLHHLWGVSHHFNYQYTSDTGFDAYQAHSASYVMPFPNGHSVLLFGGYAKVDFGLAEPIGAPADLTQSGENYLGGLRYSYLLPSSPRYQHEILAGFDYKSINTLLEFTASPESVVDLVVAQFVVGYRGLLRDRWGTNAFGVQLVASPGDLFSRNDNEAFDQARPGADASYFYGTLSFARETPLFHQPIFWNLAADLQWASGALVASEQMSFGGAARVRGFEPGVLLGDSGVVIRNELGFEIPGLNRLCSFGGSQGAVRFRGFFDYGWNSFAEDTPGSEEMAIGSVGGGARLTLGRHVAAVVDYGLQIIGKDAEERGGSLADPVEGRMHAFVQLQF